MTSASPMKRAAEASGEMSPKRQKVDQEASINASPVEKAVEEVKVKPSAEDVKKQIEYYMSDKNLERDAFFHGKISESADGWLTLDLIQNCNKMKQMSLSNAEVLEMIKDSIDVEVNEAKDSIRRKDNKELPKLSQKGRGKGKPRLDYSKLTFSGDMAKEMHKGGAIIRVPNLPEDMMWAAVKGCLRTKLAESFPNAKIVVQYCSAVKVEEEVRVCYLSATPFENDLTFYKELKTLNVTYKVDDEEKTCELGVELLLEPAVLDKVVLMMPEDVRNKRKGNVRKTAKSTSSKCLFVGGKQFETVQAVRAAVRLIINNRDNGEALKKDGADYNLITALLAWHPKAESKKEGMTGLCVDEAPAHKNTRCFYVLKGDEKEDFSMTKIMDAFQENPPFVDRATLKQGGDQKGEKGEGKPEAQKEAVVEEKKAE